MQQVGRSSPQPWLLKRGREAVIRQEEGRAETRALPGLSSTKRPVCGEFCHIPETEPKGGSGMARNIPRGYAAHGIRVLWEATGHQKQRTSTSEQEWPWQV